MDTSFEYIKMCEKAEEIQSQWQQVDGDSFVHHLEGNLMDRGFNPLYLYASSDFGEHGGRFIFLPRQDQLQEMISFSFPDVLRKFWDYISYSDGDSMQLLDFDDIPKVKSMEQLWLVFVMKEKYNKQWDGKEWVGGISLFKGDER